MPLGLHTHSSIVMALDGTIEGELYFKRIADSLPTLCWLANKEGVVDFRNRRWYEYCGVTETSVSSESWSSYYEPGCYEDLIRQWRRSVVTGTEFKEIFHLRAGDGTYRSFSTHAVPVRFEGEIVRWLGMSVDVTEQLRVEGELRKSEEQLRALNESLEKRVEAARADRDRAWNNSRDLLAVIDTQGIFHAVNPAWTSLLGWKEDELVGKPIFDFIHTPDLDLSKEALPIAAVGPLPVAENQYRHKNGSLRWISWVAAPEGDMIYASGRNITYEKDAVSRLQRTEEQLRQSQKMEAVGQLTGGIAHDFNNILAGIMGNLELLHIRIHQKRYDKLDRFVSSAQASGQRAAALTQRLLAFSRRQVLDPKPVLLLRLILDMKELLERSIGPSITLKIEPTSHESVVLIDAPQLENALLNLCINSRDALPDGGTIAIDVQDVFIDPIRAASFNIQFGDYLQIRVIDNGCGMDESTIAKAFDPFFTTKPLGQGTGLGLSMIYGFSRQSKGHVTLDSEVDKGTTVTIFIPKHVGLVVAEKAKPELLNIKKSSGKLLLVDDEMAIRILLKEVLEDAGYEVLLAGDGAEALKILESDVYLDLLITDVGLPNGMNGRQLADASLILRKDLKVLFITGYAEKTVMAGKDFDSNTEILIKPFTLKELVDRTTKLIK